MIVYKIRNRDNPELFLKGTPTYNSWEKDGRLFPSIGKLRTFLSNVMSSEHRSRNISGWEVIELELVVKEVKAVHEVITAKKLKELLLK